LFVLQEGILGSPYFVIPAKAGIQLVQQTPRSGTSAINFACYAELIQLLDSRLRGNDSLGIGLALFSLPYRGY
jgi:hypothetical protein